MSKRYLAYVFLATLLACVLAGAGLYLSRVPVVAVAGVVLGFLVLGFFLAILLARQQALLRGARGEMGSLWKGQQSDDERLRQLETFVTSFWDLRGSDEVRLGQFDGALAELRAAREGNDSQLAGLVSRVEAAEQRLETYWSLRGSDEARFSQFDGSMAELRAGRDASESLFFRLVSRIEAVERRMAEALSEQALRAVEEDAGARDLTAELRATRDASENLFFRLVSRIEAVERRMAETLSEQALRAAEDDADARDLTHSMHDRLGQQEASLTALGQNLEALRRQAEAVRQKLDSEAVGGAKRFDLLFDMLTTIRIETARAASAEDRSRQDGPNGRHPAEHAERLAGPPASSMAAAEFMTSGGDRHE